MSQKGGPTASDSRSNPSGKIETTNTKTEKKQDIVPELEKCIVEKLVAKFGESIKIGYIKPLRIRIEVDRGDIIEIASFIKETLLFDHAESVAGTDYPKGNYIEVVYHLGSYTREDLGAHVLSLATRTDRDNSSLPSLVNIFRSVEYHERETFEMLGVYFEGHPRNDRFLLPEDWADIPPLRKEFRIKGR
ncbi:MAG TPA: NADH-quinone oxidoreductase subunit C [Nitrososphaera sp.]|jgi:NADH-quinone oxidoreductase subunit C